MMTQLRLFAWKHWVVALALGAFAFSGCEQKSDVSAGPVAEPGSNSTVTAPPTEPAGSPAKDDTVGIQEIVGDVEFVETVNLDPAYLENQRVREEVLKRIDVMPNLSPEDKDRLYVQVERARAMGKVITIPFPSGAAKLPASALSGLGESLKSPQVLALSEDPTVVFVVLGFADKRGNPEKNLQISTQRAESVVAAMRDQFRVLNVLHAVGMGSSEMFDRENIDKNRVVEVWAVLP
jgi:outer membrane protein OmpA-like peptidoglycan-associated protein